MIFTSVRIFFNCFTLFFQGHGNWKRRRVEKQVELDAGLSDMESWLDHNERMIEETSDPQDVVVLFEDAKTEWAERKPQLESLISLGRDYIQEIITGLYFFYFIFIEMHGIC